MSVDSLVPLQKNDQQQQQHQQEEHQTTKTSTTTITTKVTPTITTATNDVEKNNKQPADTSYCLGATKMRDGKSDDDANNDDVKLRRCHSDGIGGDVATTTTMKASHEPVEFSEEEEELNFEYSNASKKKTPTNIIRRLSPDSLRALEAE